MILILFTWIYMLFIFSVHGEWIGRLLLKEKKQNAGELILLGMVFQTVVVTLVAFFYRINIEYFCVNTTLTFIIAFLRRKSILEQFRIRNNWDIYCKILFLLIILLSLYRSSIIPFLNDNDTYYIQTIKWINEYGWVKGLANLHPYYFQCSPWHALQAAFNFNFIASFFNDLNGFLMVIMSYIWIQRIQVLRKKADFTTDRWLFFLPVWFVFWFQFIDAPSPDLPLFLITLLIYYYILNRSEDTNLLAILFCVYLVFIKVSIFPILVLILFLLSKKNWKFTCIFSLLLGGIFICKNILISGCPLAPYFGYKLDLEWTIPDNYEFDISDQLFYIKDFHRNQIMNVICLVALIPFVFYAFLAIRRREQYPFLLFFVLQIALIMLTSPQTRFMMPVTFYSFAYVLSRIKIPPKIISVSIYLFVLLALVPFTLNARFFVPARKNEPLMRKDTRDIHLLYRPAGIAKFSNKIFEKGTCNNFDFYYAIESSRALTGNGPLPCTSYSGLYYLYKKTGCLPAMIGNDLKDGFKSIPVKLD